MLRELPGAPRSHEPAAIIFVRIRIYHPCTNDIGFREMHAVTPFPEKKRVFQQLLGESWFLGAPVNKQVDTKHKMHSKKPIRFPAQRGEWKLQ
jgi:hypothetical protein